MMNQLVFDEIQKQIDSGLIHGAVVRTNLSDETIALGIQAGSIPMTAESRFDIASTGKVFTAACIAMLAFKGQIDLDAPFTTYLPDHALGKNCTITVRDLAAHASGFDNSKPYCSADHAEFMRRLYAWMPVNPRRTTFIYSCGNFVLLGKIAEKELHTLLLAFIIGIPYLTSLSSYMSRSSYLCSLMAALRCLSTFLYRLRSSKKTGSYM
ncbi:MAG: beta-lactamase family protein, partial [Victivallales bacterium]|nr:beta-lactamase family protein [Victivallales bacterium]